MVIRKRRNTSAARLGGLILAVLLALCLLPDAARADEPAFAIVYPSEEECVIAPGRDFYILGTAPAAALADRGVTVELFRSGETTPVRSLTGSATLAADYGMAVPALDSQYDGGMPAADTAMPDLVYDTAVPGSETDSTIKIAVTENNFCALILGGANDDGLSPQGDALTAGAYTIRVTLSSGDTITREITLGDTADKSLARYSPDEHYQKTVAFMRGQGVRLYVDPFPGYWSPADSMTGSIYCDGAPLDADVFLESLSRWRFADGLEYETGRVHMVLYNISPTCASECVEMAAVQRTGRVDSDLLCYYYDIGEPSLVADGETLQGSLVPMEPRDKLAFTRAELGSAADGDNVHAAYLPCSCAIDADIAGGVEADTGSTLALFGVAAPLQNKPSQLTSDGKNGYTAENHVASICYTFFAGGEAVCEETRAVGLEREYTEGKTALSLYEFKHVFPLEGALAVGSFEVVATALDADGTAVDGGTERFALTVRAPAGGVPLPIALGALGALAVLFVLLVLLRKTRRG